MNHLKIAVSNANGLVQHIQEIKAFIQEKNIDVMLISETHLTDKNFINVPNFYLYNTNHPAKTARGGSAIIIKRSIPHTNNPNDCETRIQCTSVTLNDFNGKFTLASLYCPPRHSIKQVQYMHFYKTLGTRSCRLQWRLQTNYMGIENNFS